MPPKSCFQFALVQMAEIIHFGQLLSSIIDPMGGCLRPSKTKSPIFTLLIDKVIDDSANKVSTCDILTPQTLTNVSSRIHKKGDLRKLVDHLSSHRYNVYPALNHLYQYVTDPAALTPVLVIVDQLVRHINSFTSDDLGSETTLRGGMGPTRSKITANNLREIDVKFQMVFFQLIMGIFDREPAGRPCVMASVRRYADGRRDRFSCDRYVSQFLARLLLCLKNKQFIEQSLQTYASLMGKSNVYLAEGETSHQAFYVLLNLWADVRDPLVSGSCSDVFNLYVSRCMESRNYSELFVVIFDIYDNSSFRPEQTIFYTQVLMRLKEEELRGQFLKGLFRYLLLYLSMSTDPRAKAHWLNGVFALPYDSLRNQHKNILSLESKINGFHTLTKWLQYNFVDINQLISFNRQSLYLCLKNNLLGVSNQQLVSKALGTFYYLYTLSNAGSRLLLIQMILQDIHNNPEYTTEELGPLLSLARRFVQEGALFDSEWYLHLPKCLEYKPQLRSQLPQMVMLYSDILQKYKVPYQLNLLERLCELSYSFYEVMDNHEGTVFEKYSFLQALINLMEMLKGKGYSDIVLLWVNGIPKAKKPNSITRYFDKYLVLQLWQILSHVKKVPDDMRVLNTQIPNISNPEMVGEIWAYEKSHPEIKIASRLSPIVNNDQPNERFVFLKEVFHRLVKTNRIIEFSETGSERPTHEVPHRSSAVGSQQSYKTDESFQEIYGMIHDKEPKIPSAKTMR